MNWGAILHPKPEISKLDTSLRFTDILFGFVIKELFIRLANFNELLIHIRLHLIAATALVLGSWIGYRRSANRSAYEIKFFNLPFIRFLVDQAMLVMYFRLAVLTDAKPFDANKLCADSIMTTTVADAAIVFGLYILWDGLGVWMAYSTKDGRLRYPKVDTSKNAPIEPHERSLDLHGLYITAGATSLMLALYLFSHLAHTTIALAVTIGLLVLYRFAKEARTSQKVSRDLGPYGLSMMQR